MVSYQQCKPARNGTTKAHLQEVGDHDRLEHVQLEMALHAADCDGHVVAHHLRARHRQRLALRGVHLACNQPQQEVKKQVKSQSRNSYSTTFKNSRLRACTHQRTGAAVRRHSGKIALTGSRCLHRLHSTVVVAPVLLTRVAFTETNVSKTTTPKSKGFQRQHPRESHYINCVPGMMLLPGSFSGSSSSPKPQRGPEPKKRMSFAIFINDVATVFNAPLASTAVTTHT